MAWAGTLYPLIILRIMFRKQSSLIILSALRHDAIFMLMALTAVLRLPLMRALRLVYRQHSAAYGIARVFAQQSALRHAARGGRRGGSTAYRMLWAHLRQ